MRKLYYILLLSATLMSSGCSSVKSAFTKPEPAKPFTFQLPEGVEPPASSVNGWNLQRTGLHDYTYFPPQAPPGKVKYKNVGNTKTTDSNNSGSYNDSKKSGNTGSLNDNKKQGQQQDVGNVKQKGSVVGDGNTVEERKSLWWLWVLVVVLALVLWKLWPLIKKTLPIPLPF